MPLPLREDDLEEALLFFEALLLPPSFEPPEAAFARAQRARAAAAMRARPAAEIPPRRFPPFLEEDDLPLSPASPELLLPVLLLLLPPLEPRELLPSRPESRLCSWSI